MKMKCCKRISQKLINNIKPSLTGFPLVGFSRVEIRKKSLSIFSEFCILLIFYFCVENDVHNPHVSVLKFIFC
jgi:hypothetical protein